MTILEILGIAWFGFICLCIIEAYFFTEYEDDFLNKKKR